MFLGTQEHWFTTRDELDAFRAQQEEQAGGELAVGDTDRPSHGDGRQRPRPRRTLHIVELHEVRTINNVLAELAKMGFSLADLIPQERTGIGRARASRSAAASTTPGWKTCAGCCRRFGPPAKRD